MGMSNRDIDDGLALVYLMENKDVDLLFITCTYGNDSVDKVYNKTVELCQELSYKEIDIYKGAGDYRMLSYDQCEFENFTECFQTNTGRSSSSYDFRENLAAKKIVASVKENPGQISILATGSMQNIYDAYRIDSSIVSDIKEIVVMGGIDSPLYFNGKKMNELNFSICSQGAACLIYYFKNVTILTGNRCMDIEFTEDDYYGLSAKRQNIKNSFILDKIEKWMDDFKSMYNYESIVLWDVIAAIYLTDSYLFEDESYQCESSLDDLKTGYLNLKFGGNQLNIPKVIDSCLVNKKMIDIVFN